MVCNIHAHSNIESLTNIEDCVSCGTGWIYHIVSNKDDDSNNGHDDNGQSSHRLMLLPDNVRIPVHIIVISM